TEATRNIICDHHQMTTYYFERSALIDGGASALSTPPASATTKPLPPDTPTDVTATTKSSTKITVSWSASARAEWYQVFSSTSPLGPFTKFGGTSGTTGTSLVIWGLNPGTTYYFEVRANDPGGSSELSSPPAFAITNP